MSSPTPTHLGPTLDADTLVTFDARMRAGEKIIDTDARRAVERSISLLLQEQGLDELAVL